MSRHPEYLDVLDTVRLSSRNGQDATADRVLARARLSLALLQGRVPVLSQTQVFDSPILLPDTFETSDFQDLCQLFSAGLIQMRPFGTPGAVEAFRRALARDLFVFSAWPELPDRRGGSADPRGDLLAFLEDGRVHGLTPALHARAEALVALDRHEKRFEGRRPAQGRAPRLAQVFAQVRHGLKAPGGLAPILDRLASQPGDRSALYGAIEAGDEAPALQAAARELVDACYNRVVAGSLGLHRMELTLAATSAAEAAQALLAREEKHLETQVAEVLLPPDGKALRPVDWTLLRDFRQRFPEGMASPHYAKAGSAFLAQAIAQRGQTAYGLALRLATWAIPTALGAAAGWTSPASSSQAFQMVLWGAPGALGHVLHTTVTRVSTQRLEKRFRALLGTVRA
ncbi:hypothetical protein [Mesoterricola sediminis]|uniref:Uncharacterized protein n=1 Tax=Mesoterricola sediminis TaxID=2927980 RepID=A0AA48GWY9_9BACT|nr:hypothetical protein [Mesoterricola sediminis]BDU77804.1 hypothetical protein METESE_27620 [Mesoterricola sediminis]